MRKQVLRSIFVIVSSLLLILPTFAQTGDTFRVTANAINARSGPGIEFEVVGQLRQGVSYPVLDYSLTRNWVLLDVGGTQAWAFRHLGEIRGTVPPLPQSVVPAVNTPTVVEPTVEQEVNLVDTFLPPVTEMGVDLTQTQTIDQFNRTVGITTNMRLRFAPSFNSRILLGIPFTDRPTPIGRSANGTWIQVDYEGTHGWLYFLYVVFPPALEITDLPVTG